MIAYDSQKYVFMTTLHVYCILISYHTSKFVAHSILQWKFIGTIIIVTFLRELFFIHSLFLEFRIWHFDESTMDLQINKI